MDENHHREQYFFDAATLASLARLITPYKNPCLLCAPMLARTLQQDQGRGDRGKRRVFRLLDTDDRFADLPGFVHWDLMRPTAMSETYDLIFCDPPFFNVPLSRVFTALRLLAKFDYRQRVMIAYLTRREGALLGTLARFNLEATGIFPGYQTVDTSEKTEIQIYANFDVRSGLPSTPREKNLTTKPTKDTKKIQ